MIARLGTRMAAGVFGFGMLLGAVASATAALPGALAAGANPRATPDSTTTPVAPTVNDAAGRLGSATRDLTQTPDRALHDPTSAVNDAASQAADAVGPQVAPTLQQLNDTVGDVPSAVPSNGLSGLPSATGQNTGPLGPLANQLPVVGALTGPLNQGRQLLGPAVGAMLNDTPLSSSGSAGLAPLSNTISSDPAGLPVNTGTVTGGVTHLLGGQ